MAKRRRLDSNARRQPEGQHSPSLLSKISEIIKQVFEKQSAGLFILLLLTVIGTVFKDFILLNKIYLFKDMGSDSINFNYPQYAHIADYFRNEGFPRWSFNQGMGQNITGFNIPDPFNLILVLLEKKYIAWGLAFTEIFKIVLSGVLFFLFLRKATTSAFAAVAGGLMYACCSFNISGSTWNTCSTEALCLAFMLYAFEIFFQQRQWFLLPPAFAFVTLIQPLDLYLFGLFLGVYMTFRFLESRVWELKDFAILGFKTAACGFLGVAMSSFFLLSNVLMVLESPRVAGGAGYFSRLFAYPLFGFEGAAHNITALLRLFSNDLLGTGNGFKGWINYLEAPMIYGGLINLLLVPQVFLASGRKKKILYAAWCGLFAIPIVFPFFRYALWLFSGDYYRVFSLLVTTALIFLGARALDQNQISWRVLVCAVSLCLLALYFPYPYVLGKLIKPLRLGIAVGLVTYTVLLYLLRYEKIKMPVQVCLLLVLVFELVYMSRHTLGGRQVVSGAENRQKTGYNDYTTDALALMGLSDKSFYRVLKEYASGLAMHPSMNDAMIQNFKGTPSYCSFNQRYYIQFLQALGIIQADREYETRWAPGLNGAPMLQSFASVKYALTKSASSPLLQFGFTPLSTVGDVRVLINPYALPLGFTYDAAIRASDFKKLSPYQKGFMLYKAFVAEDSNTLASGIAEFKPSNMPELYTYADYDADIQKLKKTALVIETHGHNLIRGHIDADQTKMLFFSIPFDRGWRAQVDGVAVRPVLMNVGFMGFPINKGQHRIVLSYHPPYFWLGTWISCLALSGYMSVLLLHMFRVIRAR